MLLKIIKKIVPAFILSVFLITWISPGVSQASENLSIQLKTVGNKVVLATDETTEIRLAGLNIPSLEWGTGENIRESTIVGMDLWNSNVIRLPITASRWMAENSASYRKTVADVVEAASVRGKYVIIDLHEYESPKPEHIAFWESVCDIYGNNPTILFGVLNEPHGTTWEVWRNGGTYGSDNSKISVGHQKIVETIRDKGAKNVLVVGGLDYAYILSGIVGKAKDDPKVYALVDQGSGDDLSKAGNGIIYDTHIYTWKKNWDTHVEPVRALYPVISGEFGWDAIEDNQKKYGTGETHEVWMSRLFAFFDKDTDGYSKMHFTGWCFHHSSSPRILRNWRYEPTEFLGEHVYNKLTEVNSKGTTYKNYSNNFEPDSFVEYIYTKTGSANVSHTIDNNALKVTYTKTNAQDKSAITAHQPSLWYLADLNEVKVKIQGQAGMVIRIGIQEADSEIWTKDITLTSDSLEDHTILISDLIKAENYKGTGTFTSTVTGIYAEMLSASNGTVIFDDFEFICLPEGNVTKPADVPYIPREFTEICDMDNKIVTRKASYNGSKTGDTFNAKLNPDSGYKGTQGLEVYFTRVEGSAWGGDATCDFPADVNFTDGKYFSFLAKGDGGDFSMSFNLLGSGIKALASGQMTFKNDEWYQYTFNIQEDFGIFDTDKVKQIKFHSIPIGEGSVIFDNFTISTEIPELLQFAEKEYVNTFTPDVFTQWTSGIGNKWNDTLTVSDTDNGKKLSFKTQGLWAGYAFATFPYKWDFANITHIKIVAQSDAGQSNKLTFILRDNTAPVFGTEITVPDSKTEFIIPIDREKYDISNITSMFFTTTNLKQVGDITISEITFLNYEPQE